MLPTVSGSRPRAEYAAGTPGDQPPGWLSHSLRDLAVAAGRRTTAPAAVRRPGPNRLV